MKMLRLTIVLLSIIALFWFTTPNASSAEKTFIANCNYPKFDLCTKNHLFYTGFYVKNRQYYFPNENKYHHEGRKESGLPGSEGRIVKEVRKNFDFIEFPSAPKELLTTIQKVNSGIEKVSHLTQSFDKTDYSIISEQNCQYVGFGILGKIFLSSPAEIDGYENAIEFSECTKIEK